MHNSAKWGWSAAAAMTFVSAILAGMLWGRSQTTPTAEAQSIREQLLALPGVKKIEYIAVDSAMTLQDEAAELAELRERSNLRMFDSSVWNDGPLPLAPAPENHPDDLPQHHPPLEDAKTDFPFFQSFTR